MGNGIAHVFAQHDWDVVLIDVAAPVLERALATIRGNLERQIKKGSLRVGDKIWIKGHTTDLVQDVTSMQIEHAPITEGKQGEQVGVKVSSKVRRNDRVYKVS